MIARPLRSAGPMAFASLVSMVLASPLGAQPPLKIAITPVLVEHYLEVNRQLIAYVGEKLGRPTDLVQRRSYKEISDLLEKGEVDVAFVCGRPYVIDHDRFNLELLVAPLVYDEPIYYSYVIVPRDSPAQRFEDLRGTRYAFSDPLSNSGHLVPMNGPAIVRFRFLVGRLWHPALARRSHTGHVSWERMYRLNQRLSLVLKGHTPAEKLAASLPPRAA
jgi:ABC transporter, phosphonate, periplasmic substrate-binding protein